MTQKELQKLGQVWNSGRLHGYDDEAQANKELGHKLAKKALKEFATKYLGLTKDQFDVRSNMGGIAVSGEVTLHTDPFRKLGIYVQISQSAIGSGGSIMFRTCTSRKDYTGGPNNWADIKRLIEDPANFAALISRMV